MLGTWYHVAFTYDAATGTQRLFVNGSPIGTNTAATNALGYDTNPVTIGSDIATGQVQYGFAGSIDEVRIWSFARPPVDVQGDAAVALTGSETGLRGYWRFNEGTGTATADASGKGNAAPAPLQVAVSHDLRLKAHIPDAGSIAIRAAQPMGSFSGSLFPSAATA